MAFRKILCATDLSDISARALRVGGQLAKELGADLFVLHVVDIRGLTSGVTELDAYVDVGGLLQSLEGEAKKALPDFIAQAGLPEGVRAQSSVVRGMPVDAILEEAKAREADLIVVGTHGRSGFTRLFFGSVAEKIVRLAHTVPVLTVGPEADG